MPKRRIKLEDDTVIGFVPVRVALGQSKYTIAVDYSDGRTMTCSKGKHRFRISFDSNLETTWASLRSTLEENNAPIPAITKRIKDALRKGT